jgi:transcriptional regulator with XRE-family HTH domain
MQTLGEKIRELREATDMSLREFAKKLGVSPPFWSDVELGRRYPSDEKLADAARLLRVDVEELQVHDTRPPVEDLRRLTAANPAFGIAFRRVIEECGTPEELMKLVDDLRKKGEGR